MARKRPKSEYDKRTVLVTLRVSKDERAELKELAKKAGMTMQQFVYDRCFNAQTEECSWCGEEHAGGPENCKQGDEPRELNNDPATYGN